jgi:alginate lyase
MSSVGPSPRRSSIQRRTLFAVIAGIAFLIIGLAIYASTAGDGRNGRALRPPLDVGSAGGTPSLPAALADGYLVSADELRERAALARDGIEPYRGAVDDLLAEAANALTRVPQPVNPLSPRKDRFLDDTRDAYTLALAWVVTGDDRYARQSADFITAWVDGVHETRDTCPDTGGSDCATSLLVSRCAPAFVFAATLLEGSDALTVGDDERLRAWLSDLILPAASKRTNNWGDAGTFMRLAVADYVRDGAEFAAAIDDWRASMDLVTADGQIPEETRRGSLGLLYTQGAISYKVGAAVIAERRGVDLWNYEGSAGGTLRAAIDTLATYWLDPTAWPWHDGRLSIPNVDPAWEFIYQRWPEPAYARIFAPARPLGATNPSAIVWTTLTDGEPIDDGSASVPAGFP